MSQGIFVKSIIESFTDCPDIIKKKVYIDNQHEAFFIYVKGLINKDLIQRDFIAPILEMSLEQLSNGVDVYNLPCVQLELLDEAEKVVEGVMSGESVFLCDALPYAVSCMLLETAQRGIDEPETEKNVRGPHEGFIEILNTNISILRRKIKNNKLKIKTVNLGVQTNQNVAVVYIEGIANEELVSNLIKKISTIKIDGLNAIGYVEQLLTSHPNSIFPQFLSTERPDKAVAALLEGRIIIMQEGTPATLIAPVGFISFFQALDDYSNLWILGSFLRMFRFIALIITVMLPALYIAVTMYHYYAVPLDLLIPLAESRAKVPFPPIVEVLILEATVEMVREASVRLPTYIGTAISVVAGLIIGQAAVEAGIVSNLLIIIVAATAIASYTIPSFDMAMAIRILRFANILAASIFGIIGIVVCTALAIAHLIGMESLGQPYFQPFSPFNTADQKDTFLRLPIKAMTKRPFISRSKNRTRGDKDERKQ